ncbi:hypothetical protein AvCA_02090 [Azotobacter vinelandii CA]|uniref:Uncharacterized protein n=2 Tax=Azotobacter vinelandii TaxID=354 RepID=C1DH63_AZOVD|nr:hypothetical protein Avin_02090 [Azotobacter vinelandii DJ]AGK17389.1 hypothetical protein AvCA_02090 [Azotobacter vinelandii CA]AGK19146.1 hypothetical protein AvCA6_02090 [Azotobacter vinelandii CA6]
MPMARTRPSAVFAEPRWPAERCAGG